MTGKERFEYFTQNGVKGLELDIIPEGKFTLFIRYQVYLNFISEGNKKAESVKLTSEECNCDISGVYRAVQFFAENCKG